MLSTLMDHVKSVCVLPACCNFCAESFGGKILRSREGHQALRWRHRSGPMLLRRGSFQGLLELRRARPWRTLAQRFPLIWRLRRLCSSRIVLQPVHAGCPHVNGEVLSPAQRTSTLSARTSSGKCRVDGWHDRSGSSEAPPHLLCASLRLRGTHGVESVYRL
jgi:hypothetical protein